MEADVMFTASYNNDTKELDVDLKKGDEDELKKVAYVIYAKLGDETAREKLEELRKEFVEK